MPLTVKSGGGWCLSQGDVLTEALRVATFRASTLSIQVCSHLLEIPSPVWGCFFANILLNWIELLNVTPAS